LHAIDRGLHFRIEALHAQARAVDAGAGECGGELGCERPRINLDGIFSEEIQVEPVLQCIVD
jgi:hypothetical protein